MPRLDQKAIAEDVRSRAGVQPSLATMALIVTKLTAFGECDLKPQYGVDVILSAADYWVD